MFLWEKLSNCIFWQIIKHAYRYQTIFPVNCIAEILNFSHTKVSTSSNFIYIYYIYFLDIDTTINRMTSCFSHYVIVGQCSSYYSSIWKQKNRQGNTTSMGSPALMISLIQDISLHGDTFCLLFVSQAAPVTLEWNMHLYCFTVQYVECSLYIAF